MHQERHSPIRGNETCENRFFCRICIVLYALIPVASKGLEPNSPRVAGHVFYKDGTPVKGADVEVHFYYRPTGAILQETGTKTDEKGYFSIAVPPNGEGVVSASKASEGYPNAALAIYGRTGYASIQRVNITAATVLDNIKLRFGGPDATVEFKVQAANSNENISTAHVQISLSNQPDIFSLSSVSKDGSFSFVLPKSPVIVKVSAPQFTDWTYTDPSGKGNTLLVKPGTHQQIVVLLNPAK
jgi:hypothetical protein